MANLGTIWTWPIVGSAFTPAGQVQNVDGCSPAAACLLSPWISRTGFEDYYEKEAREKRREGEEGIGIERKREKKSRMHWRSRRSHKTLFFGVSEVCSPTSAEIEITSGYRCEMHDTIGTCVVFRVRWKKKSFDRMQSFCLNFPPLFF